MNLRGRPRDLDAVGGLGLVLAWFRTKCPCNRSLVMIFGQTSTPLYKWLKFARCVLLSVLMDDPDSQIRSPTAEEVASFQAAIGAKYPYCADVWGALDGLKASIEKPDNENVQNQFYNGWTHGHYVNSIFLFSPDGKIRMTVFNCPGVMHDSDMANHGLYEKMERVYEETGGKVVVDSAFKLKLSNCLIKSSQIDPVDGLRLLINKDATSIRQLSEWGMRMIQGGFPRIKDCIKYEEEGDRKIIFMLMIHLYNFKTTNVG